MRRVWFDYIKTIKNSSPTNLVQYSGENIVVKINNEKLAIDIWSCSNIKVNCLLDALDYRGKLNTIYIYSRNHINLNLEINNTSYNHIETIIINSPGIALKSKLKFENLYLFMSGYAPKIYMTDYIATNIYIQRIKDNEDKALSKALTGFIMLPGCGEFALDPNYLTKNIQKPKKYLSSKSLDDLLEICPNTEWVCPVVSWFGTSMNIKDCRIIPGKDKKFVHSHLDDWKVKGANHEETYNISFDKYNRVSYGGTISDHSLINYLKLVKSKSLKITLYPFVQMDVEGKVWRGRLTGESKDVDDFFNDQYRPFIIHYANLTKNFVDAFIIGSEFVGLTRITDNFIDYPFIDDLIKLAAEVKSILGSKVKIIYAADWSEYHSSDGVNRPLDTLWASEYIDIIGIDAYFPINDSTEQRFTKEDIRNGWQSLEGWDYYYKNSKKKYFNQSEKWNCWKNLKYWWENEHWVGDKKTPWQPKMKPIWLTEIGFPSVDRAPNQPNVFYDHASSESAFPKYSSGNIDFTAQKISLIGTVEFCKSQNFIENYFVWCWDARGTAWGYDPYYHDYLNWETGHWVNGKIGCTGAITILPSKQNNLFIKSFTDVDIIPSLIITERLEIFTKKALKIRDDLVIPFFHLLSVAEIKRYKTIEHITIIKNGKIITKYSTPNIIKEKRSEILSKFNNKSEVISEKTIYVFDHYIVRTLATIDDDDQFEYDNLIGNYIESVDFVNS